MRLSVDQFFQWIVMGIGLGLGEKVFTWIYHGILHLH